MISEITIIAIGRTRGWQDACQNRMLEELHHQPVSIPTGGGGTVEGFIRLQSPRNCSIRHEQAADRRAAVCVAEEHALFGYAVEIRGADDRVAGGADCAAIVLIHADEHDVGGGI